jgi:hypothetical protein
MHDRPNTTPHEAPRRARPRPGKRGILWGVIAVVIAFLIGFFWQFYQATTVRATLADTEQALVLERMRFQLANAALAAQGGRYEEARSEMSSFYNRAHAEQWALPDRLRTVTSEFLTMRDDVITGLSRSNPEYAGVVFGMLQRFEEAMPDPRDPGVRDQGRQEPTPAPAEAQRGTDGIPPTEDRGTPR